MGALTMEIEKVNKAITENQRQVEKLTKQLEQAKEVKKTQKEYEKDLKIAVENDLISTMKGYFEREPFQNACINLSLASTRQEILENVPESEFERNWVDKNYERIFNKVKKIYENDLKAKQQIQNMIMQEQLEQQKAQEEKEQKFENGVKIFFNILKWICIITFLPIALIFLIVYTFAKGK